MSSSHSAGRTFIIKSFVLSELPGQKWRIARSSLHVGACPSLTWTLQKAQIFQLACVAYANRKRPRYDSRGDTAPFNKLRTPVRVRQRRSRTRSSTSTLRLRTNLGRGFLEQDDVRIRVAAEDAKTLAIGRPVKREDALGIEVGDLVAGSASDRLNPDVIHAILGDRVGYELPVCRELHAFGDSWVGVKNARRAESRNVQQSDFRNAPRAPRIHKSNCVGEGLSVGRDADAPSGQECTFNATARNGFWFAGTVQRNTPQLIVFGIAISNGFVALSGALLAQYQGFADVGMGIGMVVWGLASVIIGEALVGTNQLGLTIIGAVMGSVLFRLMVAVALRWGLSPNDLKLITAMFVFVALIVPQFIRKSRMWGAHA